jgi:arylsulfatase A-like enzyme
LDASSVAPTTPTLTATNPPSPANDNSPRVRGTAEPGSTVRLYKTAACSGAAAASGSAVEFASPGLSVSVPDDSRTTFRATATDAIGNTSGCSSDSITYVEDSTAPAPPRLTDTDPDSPANQNSIEVKGNAVAKPWFLYLTPTAPHWPTTAESKYEGAPVPDFVENPAFFESDRSDKPPNVQAVSGQPDLVRRGAAAMQRTLMSVDDLVAKVFSALEAAGEADDTLAFFISDNGYMWGEHGLSNKTYPYTHSVGIPFFMRWPARLGGGTDDQRIVATIDLAATVVDAAGLDPDPSIDGMSLLGTGARSRILLERLSNAQAQGGGIPTWASTRTATYQYTEWYGDSNYTPDDQPVFREYYDLVADPWELTNYLADSNPSNDPSPQTLSALHQQLATDLTCAGKDGVSGKPACGPAGASGGGSQGHPNVLFIVTDDQRPTETMDVMPETTELFDNQGTHFPNAYATTPVCCPSRASILSGRYAHNHGVRSNVHALRLDQESTIERRLQDGGYRTGIFGKFLNGWDLSQAPPHFDQWSIFDNGTYTDFAANEQGQMKTISEYATTYVADKAAEFIRQQQDDGNTTVKLYKAATSSDCTPANLLATGTAATFASPGLGVSVPDDTTTRFRATATDAAGNTSGCSSSSVVYKEDSTPPPGPYFNATAPASPANNNSPKVKGTAQVGSTVRLYKAATSSDCTPANLLATGTAAAFSSPGLTVSVPDNSVTRFRATATDAAGNTSVCSAGSIVYTEDSTPPPGPYFSGTTPVSPANNNSPQVKGTAQVGSTVRLYKAPTRGDCTPANLAATGSAASFASPGLTVSVPDNSTTRFRATATDAAGNISVCSAGSIVYREDSTLARTSARTPSASATRSALLAPPFGSAGVAQLLSG